MLKDLEKIIEDMRRRSYIDDSRGDLRRFCWVKDKNMPFAHLVWNLYHPEDKKVKGDGYTIHHEDEDPLNDNIENLEKVLSREHNRLHWLGPNNPNRSNALIV